MLIIQAAVGTRLRFRGQRWITSSLSCLKCWLVWYSLCAGHQGSRWLIFMITLHLFQAHQHTQLKEVAQTIAYDCVTDTFIFFPEINVTCGWYGSDLHMCSASFRFLLSSSWSARCQSSLQDRWGTSSTHCLCSLCLLSRSLPDVVARSLPSLSPISHPPPTSTIALGMGWVQSRVSSPWVFLIGFWWWDFAGLPSSGRYDGWCPPLGQVDDWIFIEMVKEKNKTKEGYMGEQCYLGLRALNIQPYLCCRMDTLSHSFSSWNESLCGPLWWKPSGHETHSWNQPIRKPVFFSPLFSRNVRQKRCVSTLALKHHHVLWFVSDPLLPLLWR